MARQRNGKASGRRYYNKQLHQSISEVLPRTGLPLCSDDGRVRWTWRVLTVTALLMHLQAAITPQLAFEQARDAAVLMYPSRRRPGRTYRGFCDALEEYSPEMLEVLRPALRERLRHQCRRSWRWRRRAVMAVDGSRINCPRTRDNQKQLKCAGKERTGPQLMLTAVFHLDSGLLWDWQRGPGVESERDHLRRMIPNLPEHTLLVADAGFMGYDLMRELIDAGHDVLIRVASNVTLLEDLDCQGKREGSAVWLWPSNRRRQAPLKLRLIRFRSRKQEVCLLTSMSPESLSKSEARHWYKRRWRVEVSFRGLKQTMGKRTMFARTPARAQIELDWAMLAMWVVELMTHRRLRGRARSRWSLAEALTVVTRAINKGNRLMPSGGLTRQLRLAVLDNYHRKRPKTARDYPQKKREHPPSPPLLRTATSAEKARFMQLNSTAA